MSYQRSKFHRYTVICAVVVAAIFGWCSVYFIMEAFVGHASGPGSILCAGFGVVAFLTSVTLLAACALTWKTSGRATSNRQYTQ